MGLLELLIIILFVYLCIYGIISRICTCCERVTYAKAYEKAVLTKQDLETTKEEFKTGFYGKK